MCCSFETVSSGILHYKQPQLLVIVNFGMVQGLLVLTFKPPNDFGSNFPGNQACLPAVSRVILLSTYRPHRPYSLKLAKTPRQAFPSLLGRQLLIWKIRDLPILVYWSGNGIGRILRNLLT